MGEEGGCDGECGWQMRGGLRVVDIDKCGSWGGWGCAFLPALIVVITIESLVAVSLDHSFLPPFHT